MVVKKRSEGDVVEVFDRSLYVDDKTTPLSVTMKKATVVKVYGAMRDTCDVRFEHDGRISHGHFMWGVHDINHLLYKAHEVKVEEEAIAELTDMNKPTDNTFLKLWCTIYYKRLLKLFREDPKPKELSDADFEFEYVDMEQAPTRDRKGRDMRAEPIKRDMEFTWKIKLLLAIVIAGILTLGVLAWVYEKSLAWKLLYEPKVQERFVELDDRLIELEDKLGM